MRTRVVEPELLETYPDDHPDAIIGREDLLLVNAVMGNHRWMVRTLKRLYRPGWHRNREGRHLRICPRSLRIFRIPDGRAESSQYPR